MIVNSLKYFITNFNIKGLIALLFTSILDADADSYNRTAPYLRQPEKTAGPTHTGHALGIILKDL